MLAQCRVGKPTRAEFHGLREVSVRCAHAGKIVVIGEARGTLAERCGAARVVPQYFVQQLAATIIPASPSMLFSFAQCANNKAGNRLLRGEQLLLLRARR